MRLILISTDRKILEQDSAVSRRVAEYKKLFEELHVVVLKRDILEAYKSAKKLIENFKLKIENCVVSTQDPFETGIVGVLLKLKYGVPLQVQLHTDFNNKYFLLSTPLNFIRFFLAHLTLPFADSVRVVSERIKKNLGELAKNISVLSIQTELRINLPAGKAGNHGLRKDLERITILTVARLEKEKDIGTAIKAFAQVAKKYEKAEFVIVGDGSQRKSLGRLVKDLGLEEKVKFVGWQNNLAGFYGNADIYISSSLFEGYGMASVEAASAGIPIVLSDAGVAGEIFHDNESAFVCKPGDIRCFATSLEKLVDDRDLRGKMGERAFAAARKSAISYEQYLVSFKKSMEEAKINYRPKNFSGRLIELIVSVFKSNRVLRFILAGGTSAAVQIGVLYLFTDILGLWYLLSSGIAFIVAIILSFILQKFWAFKDKQKRGVHVQFFKYVVIGVAGVFINTASMYFLVDGAGIWYIIAQVITGALIAVFNLLSYKKFIFKSLESRVMV